MLKNRILATLKFFDLQEYPLTLLELNYFLINDAEEIRSLVNESWELVAAKNYGEATPVNNTLDCLENECAEEVESGKGFYCLKGRAQIIDLRWRNYLNGIKREKRIRRYAFGLRHIPFVRGAALGGSQALGQQKETSDIDLLIFTDQNFLWLARTLVTIYFQILGVRRHNRAVANRFCLNHYLSVPKAVDREKNLYKAIEYGRLRPLVYAQTTAQFLENNISWMQTFLPNLRVAKVPEQKQSLMQGLLEKILNNNFGRWLEIKLRALEISRIKQDSFTFITEDELSFHPDSRHNLLLQKFFE